MSTLANQHSGTSFLDLPPELRNHVYTFLREDEEFDPLIQVYELRKTDEMPLPIARVNKHIRAESLGLLLSTSVVDLDLGSKTDFDTCRAWARLLPEEPLAVISKFHIMGLPYDGNCTCPPRYTASRTLFQIDIDLQANAEVNVDAYLSQCVCKAADWVEEKARDVTEALHASGRVKDGRPVATKQFVLEALYIAIEI